MKLVTRFVALALALSIPAAVAATPYKAERVTGGTLDLSWTNGGDLSNSMQAATLSSGHPAYSNPSGDHTVAVATNSVAPDSGGLIVTATSSEGRSDYSWGGWIFTGDGNTRRGILVRTSPDANPTSFYMLVIESGLFQVRFRKLIGQTATTLGTWLANTFPTGVPQVNTWHHMRVEAMGSSFRCWWDGHELTTTPIVDTELPTGNVGCYNFRFDLGQIPVYFDDLELSDLGSTSTTSASWGKIKRLYR
jgi:hypothetical protein